MTLVFGGREYPQGEYVEDVLGSKGNTHFLHLLSRRRGRGGTVRHVGLASDEQPIDLAPNQTALIPGVRAAGKKPISISGK